MNKIVSCILLLFVLFFGCTEKPNSLLGSNAIDDADKFFTADTILTATKDTTYKKIFNAGYATSTLVGNFSNNQTITALYSFSASGSSYIDSLKNATLDTVDLQFFVNYALLPQKTFPIELGIYEITKAWTQDTITANSLPLAMISSTEIGKIEIKDSLNLNQMVSARITDTTLIRRWINSFLDTNITFYGFAIQPKTTTPNCIIGFYTFNGYSSYLPGLFIKYTRNGVKDSVTFVSGQDTYLASYNGIFAPSGIEVQGGFGIRSKIWFDVAGLVKEPIINNAVVELTLNSSKSTISEHSPDSLLFFIGGDSVNVDSISTDVYGYGYRKDKTQTTDPTYVIPITSTVQRWIKNINKNNGLSIRWAWETYTADKAVFYRYNDVDVVKQPKLKIVYSKK